jgi:hypothetical protein
MREFRILNSQSADWLFVDQHAGSLQYISYRHFIEQALHRFLKSYRFPLKDTYIDECKKAFKSFLSAYVKNENYPGNSEDNLRLPLRLYWFKGDTGAALVDDTKCCFPLVFDSKGRSSGLWCAIRNISSRLDELLTVLSRNLDKDWDEELQTEMDRFDDRQQVQKAA